jgi:hypothetical protein
VVAYVVVASLRKVLVPDSVVASLLGRSLDISLLYVVCLVPGFVAATLNPGRWWLIGALAGYLGEVARQLVGLAIATQAADIQVAGLAELMAASLIHAIPSVVFGIAGAALSRVTVSRGGG